MDAEKRSILVVDDEELNRAILFELLHKQYEILEAENGQEALEILKARQQDIMLVLLDIVMPVMDGFELLTEMKRQDWIEHIPVILITAESSEVAALRGYELGVSDIIHKPFNPDIVIRRIENVIQLYLHKFHLESMVRQQMDTLEKQARKLKQTNNFVIDTLSTVVEFRSCESGQHIKRIRSVTKILLQALGEENPGYNLTPDKIETISSAAAMHDIGKIAIPDAVLNKPGKLTAEEFDIMRTHTIKGCEILKSLDYVQDEEYFELCYEICRHHHERWDGRGYPDGISGEQISIHSQVVALADVYDALTSERVYKPPYSHEQAVKMILDGQCGMFNPELIKCFLRVQQRLRQDGRQVFTLIPIPKEEDIQVQRVPPVVSDRSISNRTIWLLEQEREKYRILSEMSGDIIFDYDKRTDTIIFSERFKDMFDSDLKIEKAKEKIKNNKYVSREDNQKIAHKVASLTLSNSTCKAEIQIFTRFGIQWFEIYLAALWDVEVGDQCIGYIGKMTNINALKLEASHWQEEANSDQLTGLYNRKATRNIMNGMLKSDLSTRRSALLFVDIDNFKQVNNLLGHTTSDRILQVMSGEIRQMLDSTDFVGRIGGDEFVLFFRGSISREEICEKAQAICDAVKNIPNGKKKGVSLSASVGIALYPDHGIDYDTLLNRADQALCYAKNQGKDQYAFYGEEVKTVEFFSGLSEVDEPRVKIVV